jgi:peptide/nickel transport system ATP-binding protein
MSEVALLRVAELRHRYGARRNGGALAVDGVDFAVARGESFGIVGESGSGKSTIARIVSGLCWPTSGVVEYAGENVYPGRTAQRWVHSKVQSVLQDPYSSLNPRARVSTTLARALIVSGFPSERRRERIRELLDLVRLPVDVGGRRPSELSGGQRQRVAIARALAIEPELLVLDEPTSALDLSTQAQVVDLLGDLGRELGLTYVFVSHDLTLVAYFCDRMLVMQRGRAVETGSATELYYRPQDEYTKQLMAAVVVPRRNRGAG